MINWHIGTMGFAYKQWQGPFFPAGMSPTNYLNHYSQLFDAVEVDSTFYGAPTPKTVERWNMVTPEHFTFCLKTPRAITHELRLVDAHEPMMAFLDTARLLGEKLAVVLIQLPPDFTYDSFLPLMNFIKALPDDVRYAVEFRHASWETPGTTALLERHHICKAAADYIYMPRQITPTSKFLYLRFLGPRGRYPTKDREYEARSEELRQWYRQLEPLLPQVSDVYAFFNNDYTGFAPAVCNRFGQMVGLDEKEIRPWQQRRLF